MVWQKKSQQMGKDVCAGNRQAEFFEQRFQVFFRALLTVETNLVMKEAASALEFAGGAVVAFRFSHPLLRQLFHRGSCPATRSRAERSRLPPGASACSPASAR